jgi:hypothetical protein
VLRLADRDRRVVAGALVGSLAVGVGDRFSDLDLTFAVDDRFDVEVVVEDWTRALADEFGAVRLVDLQRAATTFRVFLLPDGLQLDLSMTVGAELRPAGPKFRLLFGKAAPFDSGARAPAVAAQLFSSPPATVEDLFGWGVIYALYSRACIARGRVWQAEHYVGAVRDHALSLACLREGLVGIEGRGYDGLSVGTLAAFEGAHVGSVEPNPLRHALAASTRALLHEGVAARVPSADVVAHRLSGLV